MISAPAQVKTELLADESLHADETPVKLRLGEGKGSKGSWARGDRSLRDIEQPRALVDFKLSRARAGPAARGGRPEGLAGLRQRAGRRAGWTR